MATNHTLKLICEVKENQMPFVTIKPSSTKQEDKWSSLPSQLLIGPHALPLISHKSMLSTAAVGHKIASYSPVNAKSDTTLHYRAEIDQVTEVTIQITLVHLIWSILQSIYFVTIALTTRISTSWSFIGKSIFTMYQRPTWRRPQLQMQEWERIFTRRVSLIRA